MILFVHTPKTGGKSLRNSLMTLYGDRVLLFYANPLKKKQSPNGRLGGLPRSAWLALRRNKYDVVYGHFPLDGFRWLIDTPLVEIKTAMFFREPLALAGSFYFYRKNHKKHLAQADNLVDFAKQDMVRHMYRKFLGKYSISSLDFVGIHEHYEESLSLFGKMFGLEPKSQYINKTPNAPDYNEFIDRMGYRSLLEDILSENLAIYQQATERFGALKQSFP